MNRSYDSTSANALPPIRLSESSNLQGISKLSVTPRITGHLGQGLPRSSSQYQPGSARYGPTTPLAQGPDSLMAQLVLPEMYESLPEKELLREHEKLLKVLKRIQQLVDEGLARKLKEKKQLPPKSTREDVLNMEMVNNRKIIEKYLREIKELEEAKKHRKLNQIIEEKMQVVDEISKLKKEISQLKNEDIIAAKNLLHDRPQIERQLKEHEKDLKIQLTKKHEYTKRIEELTAQLTQLKKDCQGKQLSDLPPQRSTVLHSADRVSAKKSELEEAARNYAHMESLIQESMVAKAKRNRAIEKEIQNCDTKIAEVTQRIDGYKDKISKYQKAMEIAPKADK